MVTFLHDSKPRIPDSDLHTEVETAVNHIPNYACILMTERIGVVLEEPPRRANEGDEWRK